MKLIIINGMPGVGKTTLAKQLAHELRLPLIAKDSIKEFMFDVMGVGDREWSRKLGTLSIDMFYNMIETMLIENKSVIIENAFEAEYARPQLLKLIKAYSPTAVELYCTTDPATRYQRFIDRNESGMRHKGHVDHVNYDTDDHATIAAKYPPLKISRCEIVDTTHNIDINKIITLINNLQSYQS